MQKIFVLFVGLMMVQFANAQGGGSAYGTVTGTVTDGPNGQVTFYPSSAPEMLSGAAGDYEGEIQITFADAQIQTVYDLLRFKVRSDF